LSPANNPRLRAASSGRRLCRRDLVGGSASSRAYFFFASSTQAENACSLTTWTAIGMKA